MKKLLAVFGILVTLFSSFFVFAAIGDLIYGSKNGTGVGVLLGLLVFFLGTSFSGILLARYGFRKQNSNLSEFDQEQKVLALAKTTQGRLTVAEVALHCHLTIEESKVILDKITAQGVAELQFTDNGSFFYLFPSFLAESKPNSSFENPSSTYSKTEAERKLDRPKSLE